MHMSDEKSSSQSTHNDIVCTPKMTKGGACSQKSFSRVGSSADGRKLPEVSGSNH
jgi:hypothetical protein